MCWSIAIPSWLSIEAKAWDEELTEGVGQAKELRRKSWPSAITYSTNGQGIYGIDMQDRDRGRASLSIPARKNFGI